MNTDSDQVGVSSSTYCRNVSCPREREHQYMIRESNSRPRYSEPDKIEKVSTPNQRQSSGRRPVDYDRGSNVGCHRFCTYSDGWYYIKVRANDRRNDNSYRGLVAMSFNQRSGTRRAPYHLVVINETEEEIRRRCRTSSNRSGWSGLHKNDFLFKLIEDENFRDRPTSDRRYRLINYNLYVNGIMPRDPNNTDQPLPGGIPGEITEGWCIGSSTCDWGFEPSFFGVDGYQPWESFGSFDKIYPSSDQNGLRFQFSNYVRDSNRVNHPRLNDQTIYVSSNQVRGRRLYMYYNANSKSGSKPQDCHGFQLLYGQNRDKDPDHQFTETTFSFVPATPHEDMGINYILTDSAALNYYTCYRSCCSSNSLGDKKFDDSCMDYSSMTLGLDSQEIYRTLMDANQVRYEFFSEPCQLKTPTNREEIIEGMKVASSRSCMSLHNNPQANIAEGGPFMTQQLTKFCDGVSRYLENNPDSDLLTNPELNSICACYLTPERYEAIADQIEESLKSNEVLLSIFQFQRLLNDAQNLPPECWYDNCSKSDHKSRSKICPATVIIGCWQRAVINLPDQTDIDVDQSCEINIQGLEQYCITNPGSQICGYVRSGQVDTELLSFSSQLNDRGMRLLVDGTEITSQSRLPIIRLRNQKKSSSGLIWLVIVIVIAIIILILWRNRIRQ